MVFSPMGDREFCRASPDTESIAMSCPTDNSTINDVAPLAV